MQSEDDSLWESFPQALETLEGVRRYINAFRAPLQALNNLNPNQVHALRACSVLAIPPPMERTPPNDDPTPATGSHHGSGLLQTALF